MSSVRDAEVEFMHDGAVHNLTVDRGNLAGEGVDGPPPDGVDGDLFL